MLPGFNDLKTLRPDIATEWDYEKNILLPSQVSVGSDKAIWWKCEKGHSWKASVNSRSKRKGRKNADDIIKCPYCSERLLLKGFNDLKTLYPQLADEWDYDKNILTPSDVTSRSSESVWWICHKKKHSWKAIISNRSINGSNCPYCNGSVPYTPRCIC